MVARRGQIGGELQIEVNVDLGFLKISGQWAVPPPGRFFYTALGAVITFLVQWGANHLSR